MRGGMPQLTDSDYLAFVDTALDGMLATCRDLGDGLVNARLTLVRG